MTAESQAVAFIGLGRMGSGMARNIQKAGFPLAVCNRTAAKTEPFVAAGATAARTPREAAASAEFVVTMLMDDHSVLDSVQGPDGILAGMRLGAIHIGATTTSPGLNSRLGELHATHGTHYLAAPVAGRPDSAEAGKLLTFVAGKPGIVERCRPLLKSYTAEIMVMGEDPSVAASIKLAGNFFVACLLDALGQTLLFAERRGVDPQVVARMFQSVMPHPGMQQYVDKILHRNFPVDGGFSLQAGLKDVQLMLDAAAEARVTLPYANILRDHCLIALAHGMGDRDWSALTEAVRIGAAQGHGPHS